MSANSNLELSSMQQKLDHKIKSKEALKSITSKRKLICFDKDIKRYEQQVQQLLKQQKYSFNILLKSWYSSNLLTRHGDVMKILTPAALIPPSTAELERSCSLMKLICSRLQCSVTSEHLSTCMGISKFRELTDEDFQEILK